MENRKTVAIVASVMFLLSHFLPAFGGTGFGCFLFCWKTMVSFEAPLGGCLFYAGFAVSNPLFLMLVFSMLMKKGWPRFRYCLSLVLLLQVLSWFCLVACSEKQFLSTLGLGYFVWLTAYLLLFYAHNMKEAEDATMVKASCPLDC